jgi:hypothetical protein
MAVGGGFAVAAAFKIAMTAVLGLRFDLAHSIFAVVLLAGGVLVFARGLSRSRFTRRR